MWVGGMCKISEDLREANGFHWKYWNREEMEWG